MNNYTIINGELYHFGTKGMKWGRRRYQNPDGTLTEAGKKRYKRDAREQGYNKYDESQDKYYKQSKKSGRQDLDADTNRYVTEDLDRTKKVVDASSRMTDDIKRANEKAIKNKPNDRMDLSEMSDKELRDRINRELLERQYNDVFNPPKVSKGREYASKILDGVGTALTLTGSALSIALAIRTLTGGGEQ